jgi:hypothetical protein
MAFETTASTPARWRRLGGHLAVVATALALAGVGFSGCSVVHSIRKIVGKVEGNKTTMDAFIHKIQSGPTTFEATYVTTGNSPSTVVYAVEPPLGLSFSIASASTGSSSTNVHFIVNASGEYECNPPGSGGSSPWKCTKLPKASAATYKAMLDFYTPTHWVNFLHDFALAAGFAGDKITTSTKTVNGFAMSCVDFTPPGTGTSTVCTTSENILGYVKVTGNTTSFEITRYSTSPAASLFRLPPGATVTTIPTVTTTTS